MQELTSKAYFKGLNTLHLALISGQVIFGLVVYYLLKPNAPGAVSDRAIFWFQILVPAVAAIAVFLGLLIFRNSLLSIRENPDLSSRLNAYRSSSLLMWAIMEVGTLFAIVAAYITDIQWFLYFAAGVIVIFLFLRPTKNKAVRDLDLSSGEKSVLHDPGAIVLREKHL